MTTKELLEGIHDQFLKRKREARTRSIYYEDIAVDEEDEDIAELNDIEAFYWTTVESAALRAIEQLVALKERIEGRGE